MNNTNSNFLKNVKDLGLELTPKEKKILQKTKKTKNKKQVTTNKKQDK